jgi:repressor LexA
MSRQLTHRQREILLYIETCQQEGGTTPTLREIAAHFEFRSVNAARDHVRALCRKGVLDRQPGLARCLQVRSTLRDLRSPITDIPIYGEIPAGFADGREQEPDGCITVDIDTLGLRTTARTFALQVRGDSMIGKHILDGDIVICEHGVTPRSGDAVAALIDNESTLKTYLVKNRRPFLRAENPRYPELIPATELVIQGVVRTVIRKCR